MEPERLWRLQAGGFITVQDHDDETLTLSVKEVVPIHREIRRGVWKIVARVSGLITRRPHYLDDSALYDDLENLD